MNYFGKPEGPPPKDWEQQKVGLRFYQKLIEHPVFNSEPKAISEAHDWLNEIASAMLANDGNPVTWGYKNIEDRFRKFSQSHVDFIEALRRLNLVAIAHDGHCRQFGLTTLGVWQLLAVGNFRWLHLLMTDAKIRRRNKVAIAVRKTRRTVYADPTKRIIDDFRHGVKFDRDGLLKQLRLDSRSDRLTSRERHALVVHPLLAFETRKFCDLIMKEGIIYHEFMSLPPIFRRCALFDGKPYLGKLNIGKCHPAFLRKLRGELFPPLYAYGKSLGLTLVYEYSGVGVFGEWDAELPAKSEKVKAFIERLSIGCHAAQTT